MVLATWFLRRIDRSRVGEPASSDARLIRIGRLRVDERPLVWRIKRGFFHRVFVGLWVGLGTFARFAGCGLLGCVAMTGKCRPSPGVPLGHLQTSASLGASSVAPSRVHSPAEIDHDLEIAVEGEPQPGSLFKLANDHARLFELAR